MGLSRKLGGGGGAGARGQDPLNNSVPYKWSTQTYTMAELLAKFKLPCVVQCATDACTVVWSDFQFDLRQPLLLYERRTAQKVHAISLSVPRGKPSGGDGDTPGTLEEVGPPMAIPEDYEGWFGGAPKGQSKARRHLRVEGVAKSTARRFLVTTKLPAYTSSRSGDANCHVPHDVSPGEVLKRVCLLDPSPGDRDCPAVVKENGPCLECLDEKDEAVIIPLSRRAIMYEVAEVYPDDVDQVFTAAQVVAAGNSKLPRVLKLAHGEPPQLAYAFTGMVRAYSVFTEETVLAATLDEVASICLELGTDSSAQFRLSLNEAAVKRTCEYGNASYMCSSGGPRYLTSIKVSFSIQPDVADLDDIDLSFYESQASCSDMQEVEANSEFEFVWGTVKKAKLLCEASGTSDELDAEREPEANSYVNYSDLDDGSLDLFLESSLPTQASEMDKTVLKKDSSEKKEDDSPLNKEFTEKQIADLMKRKGMLAASFSGGDSMDSIPENGPFEARATDNPLYHYFQRPADENMRPAYHEPKAGATAQDGEYANTRMLAAMFKERLKAKSDEDLRDIVSDSTKELNYIEGESEVEDKGIDPELDTSLYEQVPLTPAKEYSEAEVDETDNSDNDSDVEDGNTNIGKDMCESKNVESATKRQSSDLSWGKTDSFPCDANVVGKPSGKRPLRSSMAMAESMRRSVLGAGVDTSSSDDLFSDHEKGGPRSPSSYTNVQAKEANVKAGEFTAYLSNEAKLNQGSLSLEKLGKSDTSLSSPDETDYSDGTSRYTTMNKSFSLEDSSPEPLVPMPPKPTFTEVDEDPLETTMSELDKITSIKPFSLFVGKRLSDKTFGTNSLPKKLGMSHKLLTNKSQVKSASGLERLSKWTSEEIVPSTSGGRIDKPDSNRTKCGKLSARFAQSSERPAKPQQGASRAQHADVMQEEDRYTSPKVSHHPHVHPHTTIPLGKADSFPESHNVSRSHNVNKSKVLNSIQSFERLGNNLPEPKKTDTNNIAANSGSLNRKSLKTTTDASQLFKYHPKHQNQNRVDHTVQENHPPIPFNQNLNGNSLPKPKRVIKPESDFFGAENGDAARNHSNAANLRAPNDLNKFSVLPSDPMHDADSDEETVTVEEYYVVSAESGKTSGSKLRILPVCYEDLDTENFV